MSNLDLLNVYRVVWTSDEKPAESPHVSVKESVAITHMYEGPGLVPTYYSSITYNLTTHIAARSLDQAADLFTKTFPKTLAKEISLEIKGLVTGQLEES